MKSLISDVFGNEAVEHHVRYWENSSAPHIHVLTNTSEQCANSSYSWLGADAYSSGLVKFAEENPMCDRYALNSDELKAFAGRLLSSDGSAGAQSDQLWLRAWDSKPLALLNTSANVETGKFAVPLCLFGQPTPNNELVGETADKGIGWPQRCVQTAYERTLVLEHETPVIDVRAAYSYFKAQEYLTQGALTSWTLYVHTAARLVDEYVPVSCRDIARPHTHPCPRVRSLTYAINLTAVVEGEPAVVADPGSRWGTRLPLATDGALVATFTPNAVAPSLGTETPTVQET